MKENIKVRDILIRAYATEADNITIRNTKDITYSGNLSKISDQLLEAECIKYSTFFDIVDGDDTLVHELYIV